MGSLALELTASRDALLAVALRVGHDALARPTRNPGWAVRDVLAHLLASDANLISLLDAARGGSLPRASREEYESQMTRWAGATPETFVFQLRARAARWRSLLEVLPSSALDLPAEASWIDGTSSVGSVLGDYQTHDAEHAEDVRLALEEAELG